MTIHTQVHPNGQPVNPNTQQVVCTAGAIDQFIVHVESMHGVDENTIRRMINSRHKVTRVEHLQRKSTVRNFLQR